MNLAQQTKDPAPISAAAFDALASRVDYAISLAQASSAGIGDIADAVAEIKGLRREIVALETKQKDHAYPIAKNSDAVAALSKRLAGVEKWLAPSANGLPRIVTFIAESLGTAMKAKTADERAATDREISELRSTLKITLADTSSTLRQLQELSNSHVTAAAHRLQSASRQFATGRIKAVGNLRPNGPIEQTIARSAV